MKLGDRSEQMKENKLEVFIGAVVLVVALGFVVFVYQATGLSVSNSRHYDLKADFRSADGIHVGTDVRLAGVKVGTVSGTFEPDETITQARSFSCIDGRCWRRPRPPFRGHVR